MASGTRSLRPRLAAGLVACALATSPSALAEPQDHVRPIRSVVVVDGHPVTVWSRAPSEPQAVVLLVHGRTWSSLPDWDLQVAGLERSVLRSLQQRGLAAYAVDLRGYGATPRDASGFNSPRRSAADVLAVLRWIRGQHPALPTPTLVGWSRGGAVAMMAAQIEPTAMGALVLYGFVLDPATSVPTVEDGDASPARLPNTPEAAAADFISPRVTPPSVVRAFVEQALGADPVMVDLRGEGEYTMLAASKVVVPTVVVFGLRDPAFERRGVDRFLAALNTSRRRFIGLSGADHAAHLEDTHAAWVDHVARIAQEAR